MPEHWKTVLLLMHLTDPETIRRTTEEIRYGEACEEFERWAEGCSYLVFEEYGNATEHICRHPDRDDPTEWVMCDISLCPLKHKNQEVIYHTPKGGGFRRCLHNQEGNDAW